MKWLWLEFLLDLDLYFGNEVVVERVCWLFFLGLGLGTDRINSWIFLNLEVLLNFNIVYFYWFVLGVLPDPILGQMFLRLKWRVNVLLSLEGRFI